MEEAHQAVPEAGDALGRGPRRGHGRRATSENTRGRLYHRRAGGSAPALPVHGLQELRAAAPRKSAVTVGVSRYGNAVCPGGWGRTATSVNRRTPAQLDLAVPPA
ncbi:hypothetical protein SAMN00790413_01600 [Deinococcus hopiensis KR-140]|uniref:Uncharacterized protein n=1 Tax=Deinococcus hopiensis KR-140 TaxID=695939 RepID=A0A1W1VGL3_9DEIO|nr:hypothetical protein SAMN00790413_01600 [Deinococcus hopiensis KR-140]